MPELPEVEVIRRYLTEAVKDLRISHIEFLDDLNKVYKSPRATIEKNLVGQYLTATQRVGKYLFAHISNGKWLFLHFGMTGSLEIFNDDQSQPKYSRMVIHFEGGMRLAFVDLRKFGIIRIIDDPKQFIKDAKLGPDLLDISEKQFTDALEDREIFIKTALLEQKNFAGIGNWIADEMLFDTGIHPEQICRTLDKNDFSKLLKSAKRICNRAIDVDTHYNNFPDDFFMKYRKAGARHPEFPDSPVEKLQVGGRGTYIIPAKQKLKN